jgi:hypothetical protein
MSSDKDKIKQMNDLLQWFATTQMDQFEHFKLNTKYGPIYVAITRAAEPGIIYGE